MNFTYNPYGVCDDYPDNWDDPEARGREEDRYLRQMLGEPAPEPRPGDTRYAAWSNDPDAQYD